jgi:hypothetical protein
MILLSAVGQSCKILSPHFGALIPRHPYQSLAELRWFSVLHVRIRSLGRITNALLRDETSRPFR